MKALVIYHAHCTDGFGAAYAAWLKLGDSAEYLPMNYGQEFEPTVCASRDVYILDFSFQKDVMERIIELSTSTVFLDHHKTAFETYAGEERTLFVEGNEEYFVKLDNNKSGVMLAWEYFHPQERIPQWVKHIDDRDRWKFVVPGSSEFHAGMNARKPWTFEQWKEDLEDVCSYKIIDDGEVLLKDMKTRVESIAKYAMPFILKLEDDETHTGLAVNTNVHMSEVGHELANQSGSCGLIWYLGSDRTAKVSLRSNGDYDVSAIAKQFGGGGHKNAAGFQVPITTLLGWLK